MDEPCTHDQDGNELPDDFCENGMCQKALRYNEDQTVTYYAWCNCAQSGFTGEFCEIDMCADVNCQNGGTCESGQCVCASEQFSGEFCEVDLCADLDCQNGGTCNFASGQAWCMCEYPWSGISCEINMDPCMSEPCQNGGSCENMFDGSFSCSCTNGFTGVLCETVDDPCSGHDCSHVCFDNDGEAACACPYGLTLGDDSKTCEEPSSGGNTGTFGWAHTPIREDNTIRPYYNGGNKCFYHKMNGFTPMEKIYVGDCVAHDRYRWDYDSATGLITNWNRKWIVPHCIVIPDWSVTKKKQQLHLAPCDIDNPGHSWIMENGMLKVRANRDVCIMWNLEDKTRLWSIPCGEHIFAPFVST